MSAFNATLCGTARDLEVCGGRRAPICRRVYTDRAVPVYYYVAHGVLVLHPPRLCPSGGGQAAVLGVARG